MKSKKIYCLLAVLLFIFSHFGAVCAAAPQISYTFSGYEAELPGYAEGTVTVDPAGNTGYVTLFWADDINILDGYEKIATVEIKGNNPVEYKMSENMAIPEGATRLAAFFCNPGNYKPENLSAATLCDIPQEKQFNSGNLEMTFASVSDVHMNYNSSDSSSNAYCGAPYKWTKALDYFAELGLDMVVISGDCTGSGAVSEYELYAQSTAASSYDANKIYMARGNHDSQENANYIRYSARDDMVRPFENSPWFYVLKEGSEGEKDNLFLFTAQEISAASNTNLEDNFSTSQLDWLENLLKTYAGTNTNIFIVGHAPFHNWGPGDRYNGIYVQPMILKESFPGNMRFKNLLSEYKEAVYMSGHTHLGFREMVNYSDENNTACRMIHNSSTCQQRLYDASGTSIIYRPSGVDNKNGSEGYVVGVYENDIVYRGTNLTTKEIIPTACYIFKSYSEDRANAKSISITKLPDKTKYNAGDYFEPKGMEVTAVYEDGTSKEVYGWRLKDNKALSDNTKEVTICFGALEAPVPVKMNKTTERFEGEGTKDSPYLINDENDFAYLTKCFESKVGSDSHDTNTYGRGKYFLQTADIDMTGYPGYKGTVASGNARYGFSGVYNGGGHTIKGNINSSETDASFFPYVNGVVMNVNFKGSIAAARYAQPVRTVGGNGKIINCSACMSLSAPTANGLALSNYGTIIRYFSNSEISGTTRNVYCNTVNANTKYVDCMYDGELADSSGTKVTNYAEKAAALNGHQTAGVKKAVEVLKNYAGGFGAEDINLWLSDMTVAVMRKSLGGSLYITDADEKIIANYSDSDKEIHVFTAEYDSTGRLENVKYEKATAPADGNVKLNTGEQGRTALYLWDNNMQPYFGNK